MVFHIYFREGNSKITVYMSPETPACDNKKNIFEEAVLAH
jgi:hypothetical protein